MQKIIIVLQKPVSYARNLFFLVRSLFFFEKYDLIVVDDVFPNKMSPWRYEEYLNYLKTFDNRLCILLTGGALKLLNDHRSVEQVIHEFEMNHPLYKDRLKKFVFFRKVKARLGYVVFLNNADIALSYFESNKIPFVFTLYPGGGFLLDEEESDNKLRRVTSSPFFKGVITTQKITSDYLIRKRFCAESKIHFIFGVVAPIQLLKSSIEDKAYFSNQIMNVGFIAHKYMRGGVDKGFNHFIDAAKILSERGDNFCFHVVGPYNDTDCSHPETLQHVKFHGSLIPERLHDLHRILDVVVSPNVPFALNAGSFDGFPTASSTEAALNGVAMMVTDELELNPGFTHMEDIILIKPNGDKIVEFLEYFSHHKEALTSLARKGMDKCKELYSEKNQIQGRINYILKNIDL